MSIELILLAVNINSSPSRASCRISSGNLRHVLLTVAAAEAAIGLAILVVYFRKPRHHRGRGHQSDEKADGVYAAIIFLPLLGAIIAGLGGA